LYHTKINRQQCIYRFRHHVVPYNNLSATIYIPVSEPGRTLQKSIGNSVFTGLGTSLYLTIIYWQQFIYRVRHQVVPYKNLSATVYLPVSALGCTIQKSIDHSVSTGLGTMLYLTTIYRQQFIYRFRHQVVPYKNQSATVYLPVSAPRCTIQQSIGNSVFAGFGTTLYHTTETR
jgi:hypothetical protein